VIPRSERAPDFGLRAQELVDALSIFEDRPAEEIVRDIRARGPSTRAVGSPRLQTSSRFLRLPLVASTALLILTLGAFAGIAIVWNQATADRDRLIKLEERVRGIDEQARAIHVRSGEMERKVADHEKKIPELVKQEIERALQAAKSPPGDHSEGRTLK
jgi:hypothetical protein